MANYNYDEESVNAIIKWAETAQRLHLYIQKTNYQHIIIIMQILVS